MLTRTSIALVDSDPHRRARITSGCARFGVHVEPYDCPDELASRPPAATVLAHDNGDWLEEIIVELGRRGASCALVGFAERPSATLITKAIFAGVLDYLEWPFETEELLASLDRVSVRGAVLLERRERFAHAEAKLKRLSKRERDVVDRMAQGLTNKDIGRLLQISPRTVEIHRSNALGKLGVSSSAGAIRLAIVASEQNL